MSRQDGATEVPEEAAGTTATVVPVARTQPAAASPAPAGLPVGPAQPAGSPFDAVPGRRYGRLGNLFAGVWLVYLVPTLQDALDRPLPQRVLGIATVLAFAAWYLVVFARLSRWRRAGRLPGVRDAAPVLAVSGGLFVVAALTIGQSALAMFVFIAVQAVFLLPRLQGLAVAAGLVAIEEVLSRTVPGWEPLDGLALSIALASIAIWGISGMIERNLALARAQATIAELAVQAERTRFARDLHDVLGHSLTVLTIKAELAGRLVPIDPQRAEREIAEVEQLARQAMADVRAAVSGYREVTLAGELASARAALDAAGIAADLPTYPGSAVDDVPTGRRELLAWAIREGVTNAVRHSAARHVWVRLDADGVEVADDGRGPAGDPEAVGVRVEQHGNGLAGLRERAAAVGAAVTVRRREGGGFVLRVGW
jgi:two-component system sensor histidine kinase DesK